MHRLVRLLMQHLPFPQKVGTYLVSRFPEHIGELATNTSIDPSAFDQVNTAKEKAEVATALVAVECPSLITAWCASRDKRQGVSDVVLRHWHLPVASQLAFASKALSDDSANQVLRSNWFADSAKLLAVPRAHSAAVWEWLENNPSQLDDDQWTSVFCTAVDNGPMPHQIDHAPHAALAQRPHLAQRLLRDGSDRVAMFAASCAPHIDQAFALTRIAAASTHDEQRVGLVNLLDHPSLDPSIRVQGFALAAEIGALESGVYRFGCPSPGSPLDLGVPLTSLDDPLVAELIAMRSLGQVARRFYHLVDLFDAPAARPELIYRLSEIQPRVFKQMTFTAGKIAAFAAKHGITQQLREIAPQVLDDVAAYEQRLVEQAAAAALTVPVRHSEPWTMQYRRHTSDTPTPPPAKDGILNVKLEELAATLVGYRVSPAAPSVFIDALTERLGDGTDQASLARWEQFFQLAGRTNGSLLVKQVVATAARLA